MKIALYINYLNHHQIAIADELYASIGENFICICTMPHDNSELKGGADYRNRSYCITSASSDENYTKALYYAREADVCVFGGGTLEFAIERAIYNTSGLSFEMSERWLKKGIINLLSPRLLKNLWYYHKLFKKRKFYKLCASAYAAQDQYLLQSYKERCYKWGYFIKADDIDIRHSIDLRRSSTIRLMWCARFLKLKHPELAVRLAFKLKTKGYNFILNMYGTGGELEQTKKLASSLGVEDVVKFCGNLPNSQIVEQMRMHDIFLFTSDQNEGWGVVANEAMSNGCVLVASDSIGSVPFLLKDGENGCVFKSGDLDSLLSKVENLMKNPTKLNRMAYNGHHTMKSVWSAQNAITNLLQLIQELQSGISNSSIIEGPCSKAKPL